MGNNATLYAFILIAAVVGVRGHVVSHWIASKLRRSIR